MSYKGTQFRIWANSVLKDYLIKGYAVKNSLIQERYDELKALVDTMGRAMQYLETGDGDQKATRKRPDASNSWFDQEKSKNQQGRIVREDRSARQ